MRSTGASAVAKDGSIGFLKSHNRTNVLLSRAKEGMYVIGQADLFERESTVWAKVLDIMRRDDLVGDGVTIYCQKHPEILTEVSVPRDFAIYSPDGGCLLPCGTKLPNCGHTCPRLCHSDLANHFCIFCPKTCLRLHEGCGHCCSKSCGEDCGRCEINVGNTTLQCSHINENTKCFAARSPELISCQVLVKRRIPECNHEGMFACAIDDADLVCLKICNAVMECGHPCTLKCHVKAVQRAYNHDYMPAGLL